MDRRSETDLSNPANLGVPTPSPQGVSGSIAGNVLPLRRAEELIATLSGVLSVRIVPNDSGAIDEIHVLTTDAVAPKSTVRNIESALIAQLGMRVNHRKISIATTLDPSRSGDAGGGHRPSPAASVPVAGEALPASRNAGRSEGAFSVEREVRREVQSDGPRAGEPVVDRAGDPQPAPGERAAGGTRPAAAVRGAPSLASALAATEGRRVLIFEDVEVRRSRTKGVLCRVTLSRDESHFVGESEGQESERSRVELAARAALQAISDAATSTSTVGGDRSLALEGAKLIDAFDRAFIFVSVTARIGREMVVLTGSCEVRDSAETSAVLAILDATNRWLHLER